MAASGKVELPLQVGVTAERRELWVKLPCRVSVNIFQAHLNRNLLKVFFGKGGGWGS
jgi:hypothetical protein